MAAIAIAVSVSLGFTASRAAGLVTALFVAVMTLLPLLAHARRVGLRRALTEPSVVGIILIFYLFIFPLRGLVIALGDYNNVEVALHGISAEDVVATLLLASIGTTALVEAFHFVCRRHPRWRRRPAIGGGRRQSAVTFAAAIMAGVALASLIVVVVQHGGLTATQAAQLSHSKELALSGEQSTAFSLWAILAVPAVWAATIIAVDANSPWLRRAIFVAIVIAIIALQLFLFGSRLNALLSIVGAWVVFFYSGRAVPVAGVAAGIFLLIWLSVPILNQRPGGQITGVSVYERYSRITGYSVLDAALGVRQEPTEIRAKLEESSRWIDLPQYLVPSAIWPDKPNLEPRRMDLFVVQSLGNQAQQTSGMPTTYVTELWIYGGWLAVIVASIAIGAMLGTLHRRLVGSAWRRSLSSNLLWYCLLVTVAFSYYKDGDILTSTVGSLREAVYLGLIMLATGVWIPFRERRSADLTARPSAQSGIVA